MKIKNYKDDLKIFSKQKISLKHYIIFVWVYSKKK